MSYALAALLLGSMGGRYVDVPPQLHQLIKCDSGNSAEIVRLVTREDVFGSYLQARVRVHVYEPIFNDLKLRVTMFTPDGYRVPCVEGFGSCLHDLCKPGKITMNILGNGTAPGIPADCPLNPGTYDRTLNFKLSPELNKYIKNGDVLGTLKLESGSRTVGCQAYYTKIHIRRPTTTELWYK